MVLNTGGDPLAQGVRRLTTGVDARGKAVIVRDERVEGHSRGLVLWGADAPPIAGDSALPPISGWWPPPGGVRISLSTRAPDARPDPHAARPNDWPDINDDAGFHASQSVDVIVVISGRIWLELDDGVETVLSARDVLVQNGARHRWRNRGDDCPCSRWWWSAPRRRGRPTHERPRESVASAVHACRQGMSFR